MSHCVHGARVGSAPGGEHLCGRCEMGDTGSDVEVDTGDALIEECDLCGADTGNVATRVMEGNPGEFVCTPCAREQYGSEWGLSTRKVTGRKILDRRAYYGQG